MQAKEVLRAHDSDKEIENAGFSYSGYTSLVDPVAVRVARATGQPTIEISHKKRIISKPAIQWVGNPLPEVGSSKIKVF